MFACDDATPHQKTYCKVTNVTSGEVISSKARGSRIGLIRRQHVLDRPALLLRGRTSQLLFLKGEYRPASLFPIPVNGLLPVVERMTVAAQHAGPRDDCGTLL
jgi:hypothetical protein